MSNTPRRSIRIPDDTWLPAQQAAADAGTNVSALIKEFLAGFTETPADHQPAPPGN